MSNGIVMVIHLIVGLIKMMLYIKMSQYSPKPYEPFGGNISVKVELSNYETKADLTAGINTSKQAAKSDLTSLKAEIYKLDIDKLVPVPVDLSKLSDAIKNNVVKKQCMINSC